MSEFEGKPFPDLKNDLFIRTALGEVGDRVPVWIMRQAGRYLPEFREVRAQHDFNKVCRTPELACQVTLQPIDRYSGLLDAAIIFSDILVVSEALGLKFEVKSGYGIHFEDKLEQPEDVDNKLHSNVDVKKELGYVLDAIRLTRHKLEGRVPLIGFSGAPWTLASYMIEGKSGTNHSTAKRWLLNYPEASHKLLTKLTDVIIEYLVLQAENGAQALQLFDSWAGELSPADFQTFSYPYITKIGQQVKERLQAKGLSVPLILFAKGAHSLLPQLSKQNIFNVIGLDWTIDPSQAVQLFKGSKLTLQGNLDPIALYAEKEQITKYTEDMLKSFDIKNQSLIANLGHGMLPDHDPEHLRCYLESVHRISKELRK